MDELVRRTDSSVSRDKAAARMRKLAPDRPILSRQFAIVGEWPRRGDARN